MEGETFTNHNSLSHNWRETTTVKMNWILGVLLPLAAIALLASGDEEFQMGAMEQILDVNLKLGKPQQNPETPRFFEGDVVLTPRQQLNLDSFGDIYGPTSGRSGSDIEKEHWPGGIIPYEIDCSLENLPLAIEALEVAMREWENRTCIRFVKRTNQKTFLKVIRGMGCWCHVGHHTNYQTRLSIGNGCEYKHVMVHELGHAIGFWHEQSRYDRDDFVEVIWENIYSVL